MNGWPINPFDTAVIVIVLLSGALAFLRGFTREVLSLLAWVGAAVATYMLFPYVRPYGHGLITTGWLADGASGLIIFIPSLIIFSLLSHGISQRVRVSAVSALDRTLGFIFGLARGGVLVVILFQGLGWLTPLHPPPEWLQDARTLPLVKYGSDLFFSPNTDTPQLLQPQTVGVPKPPDEINEAPDKEPETGYKTMQRRALEQLINEGNVSR